MHATGWIVIPGVSVVGRRCGYVSSFDRSFPSTFLTLKLGETILQLPPSPQSHLQRATPTFGNNSPR